MFNHETKTDIEKDLVFNAIKDGVKEAFVEMMVSDDKFFRVIRCGVMQSIKEGYESFCEDRE